jgi:sec-independent protein translocase protein TatB
MFDIGWSEMLVIALLTLIVIGPKELPRVMRTVGQWVRKAQSLAREFQRGIDEMAREADLEDAKKLLDGGRSLANPKKLVMDTLDPTGSVEDEARDLQSAMTAETPDAKTIEKAKENKPGEARESEPGSATEASQAAGDGDAKPAKQEPAKQEPAKQEPAKQEPAQATIVKTPVNVAPPDSVTPPADPGGEAKSKTPKTDPASPDGSHKTA